MQRFFAVGLLTLLLGVGWWQIRLLGDLRLEPVKALSLYGAIFAMYLLALGWVKSVQKKSFPSAIWLIVLSGLVFRGFLITTPATLSDDIFRYRWDGRVQQAGFNPYKFAPVDERLTELRDEEFSKINFMHLKTVYPPVLQWVFRLGVQVHDSLLGQKLVFLFFELCLIVCLWALLKSLEMNGLWLAAYVWHPLPILEIAQSGHNDIVAVFFLWLGVLAWVKRNFMMTALAWAASVGAKFLAVIFIPWWLAHRDGVRYVWAWAIGVFVLLGVYPGFFGALFESLSAMTGRVESNASVFFVLIQGVSPQIARWVVAGLGVLLSLFFAIRENNPIRYLQSVLFAAILLSPALHPWYVVWLIPGLCFWRMPAMVLLSGFVILAYAVWPGYLAGNEWALPDWARVAEYGGVLVLWLLWEIGCQLGLLFRRVTKPTP